MAQEVSRSNTPAGPEASSPLAPGARSVGVRACPSCGASVNVNATVCAACGERMPGHNRTIRCRRCRQRANASLVVCPHCGRELHSARSRWLTWGAPLALVALFGLLLLARGARSNPVAWAQARAAGLGNLVGDISEQLDPDVNIVFVPPDTAVDEPLVSQAALSAAVPTTVGEGAVQSAPVAVDQPAVVEAPVVVEQPAAAPDAPAAPTATPTSGAVAATATPPAAPATAADAAAIDLATPTPLANLYRVQRGDTVFDIAIRYGVTEDELLAANNLSARDAFTLQPGQDLIIPSDATATPTETPADLPTETPTPAPTATSSATPAPSATPSTAATLAAAATLATAAPTPAPTALPAATPEPTATTAAQTYTVRVGDTLAAIAIRNGVTIESILTTNNLTLAQGRQLRPGQQLSIPARAQEQSLLQLPTATPDASGTTTRLAAPVLFSPENNAVLSCASNATLAWEPAPEIRVDDLYVVHLGYVDADDAVVWVAQPQRAANVIAWEVDAALCDLPPDTASGEWQWWVEVVAETGGAQQPVSPPSEIRSFVWR